MLYMQSPTQEGHMRTPVAVAILSAWAVLAPAYAQTPPGAQAPARGVPIAVTLGPGSELWLEGDSNVHDFHCRTAQVGFEMTRDSIASQPSGATGLYDLIRASGVSGVAVRVPVKTLRSGKD